MIYISTKVAEFVPSVGIPKSLFLATILLVILLGGYRIFFHPLSRYPGPFLAKLSSLYVTYHVYRGDNHITLLSLHEKYGDIVRIGPNTLSMKSATALKDIYGHGSPLVKSHDFYSAFSAIPGLYNTHNAVDKKMHSRKRRVMAHAFSEVALKDMEEVMIEQIQKLCHNLEQEPKAMDMSQWFNYFTYDFMGELCFGKGFSMMSDESNRFVMRMVDRVSHASSIFGWFPECRRFFLDKIFLSSLATDRYKFILEARRQADARMKQDVSFKKDFFYYLLMAKDPETGDGFAPQELWEEAAMLMVAGSDTTSTALASTMYYLVRNPECLATAAEEVRGVFQADTEIVHGTQLSQCIYLRSCIDEALRLCPPVPGLLPRDIIVKPATIDGEKLPCGTTVGTPCWALHRDKRYFPEPTQFRPTRWTDDSAEKKELARSAYAPFSIGPRGCIGKSLALMESRVTLATILWLFNIEVDGHLPATYEIEDHFTAQKQGPFVRFERRKS